MIRRLLPRFPGFRALVPRVSRPLLPLTSRLSTTTSPRALTSVPRTSDARLFHHTPARLTTDSPPSPPPHDPSTGPPPNASLSERLKYLIKYYGWYALGVYFILSALDFTVAFAAINVVGAEHVSRVAAVAKDAVANLISSRPPEPGREEMDKVSQGGHGSGQEGLYAMIVLAYTIHKTLFLPIRVGLTAAVTPKLVRWLGQRGWVGGAGTKRAASAMRDRIRDGRNHP